MSSPISNHKFKTTFLDIVAEKENLNYISKFRLPSNIAQHINSRLIFNDIHIDDSIIASDIELNSWILNCLKSY